MQTLPKTIKPETLARMKEDLKIHSHERFLQVCEKTMNEKCPEIWASSVIGFGKRAEIF